MEANSNAPVMVPAVETTLQNARELERQLIGNDIEVMLAKPPKRACCGGSCGCGAKVQVLVRELDMPRVQALMHHEWLEAVRREGVEPASMLVPLKVSEDGTLPCPACGFSGVSLKGACGDCGLQLE